MRILDKRVDMVAVHDGNGKVKPLRFRTVVDDEPRAFDVKVKISEELRIEKEKVLSFSCEFADEGILKPCELRFYPERIYWTLYKI